MSINTTGHYGQSQKHNGPQSSALSEEHCKRKTKITCFSFAHHSDLN